MMALRVLAALALAVVTLALTTPVFRDRPTPTRGSHTCYGLVNGLFGEIMMGLGGPGAMPLPTPAEPAVELTRERLSSLPALGGPGRGRELAERAAGTWLGSGVRAERFYLVLLPPGTPAGPAATLPLENRADSPLALFFCTRHGSQAWFRQLEDDGWSARDVAAKLGLPAELQARSWTRPEMEEPFRDQPSANMQEARELVVFFVVWLAVLVVPGLVARRPGS